MTTADAYVAALHADNERLRRELRLKRYPRGERWWRFVVLRGEGIPAQLDGRWYDLEQMPEGSTFAPANGYTATVDATNRWEQRDDGEVAVVYEWIRR
jgi:hypothetical protein